MKRFDRETPQFSLCGLNCCLCPRFRTTGPSRCPGCGGVDFYEKHPACGIISCSLRHGGVEYCFQCDEYPCDRYSGKNDKDSFITYQHVPSDMDAAKNNGVGSYLDQLSKKSIILDDLLKDWDNGRLKSYYCLAVNLLPLAELEATMSQLVQKNAQMGTDFSDHTARNALMVKECFDRLAAEKGVSLQLRR